MERTSEQGVAPMTRQFSILFLGAILSSAAWGKTCGDPDMTVTRNFIDEKINEIPRSTASDDRDAVEDPESLAFDPRTQMLTYQRSRSLNDSSGRSSWHTSIKQSAPIANLYFGVSSDGRHLKLSCDPACWSRLSVRNASGESEYFSRKDKSIPIPHEAYGDKLVRALKHLKCLSAESALNDGEPF